MSGQRSGQRSDLGRDLQCQQCPDTFLWRTDDRTTEYAARFSDWKVFQGPSETGRWIDVVLCPKCGGNIARKRVNKVEPLAGQELFDLGL
jgi:hypothetical protein